MWIAHLALFRGGTLMAWFGLVVVVQNIVGRCSIRTVRLQPGWIYVFGVGVTGGAVLRGATTQPGGKP